jgi:hypothetical protein
MNKIWVIEERYTDPIGETIWEFNHACPMRHDAYALALVLNRRHIDRQLAETQLTRDRIKPRFRIREYKAVPGSIKQPLDP